MAEFWSEFTPYGMDEPMRFHVLEDFQAWVQSQIDVWAWVRHETAKTGMPLHYFDDMSGAWSQGLQFSRDPSDYNFNNLRNWIASRIEGGSADRLLVSNSIEGRDVLHIKEAVGPDAARWAYQVRRTAINLSPLHVNDIRGVVLAAFPELMGNEQYRKTLQNERRNYRDEVARIADEAKQTQLKRDAAWKRRIRSGNGLVRKWTEATRDRWDAHARSIEERASASIASITATEHTYTEQMALAAPVAYWNEKADDHKTAEGNLLRISIAYFAVAIIALFLVGWLSSTYILRLPRDVDRAAVYVIVSGGLIAFTTMMFWIGRLIVKLYLSEHHLRVDATERSTMAKTYLAMTHEGTATEAERAIVLSAIFRPTPDGIVREEGPADMSVGGMVSKFLSNPR